MALKFARPDQAAQPIPLEALRPEQLEDWLGTLSPQQAAQARANGFRAKPGQAIAFADETGAILRAAAGLGSREKAARHRFALASARARLPDGVYALQGLPEGPETEEAALGWLLAGYRYDRYRSSNSEAPGAMLLPPEGVDAARLEAIAAGEALSRDLINTPASDMGPDDLEAAARDLAEAFGAEIEVISGAPLQEGFPMIHAVGRAAARAPRLIEMRWGDEGPALTLVGKGVCFDTGGLNIKPGGSMGLMKKDMGGAATVLGLARMIMALGLALRLRVLIPAVENSISGNAFRPQDILRSRKGLTVEVNNTDAEGRLVLADALALADETPPDLMISIATLTGAARVALGPDLPPFYATDEADARTLSEAAMKVRDPLWQMPFWEPYEAMLEPGIADLDNAPKGGMGGSITAALFLRRFVSETPRYLHLDIYGWQPGAAPARPRGGVAQGARALLEALPALLKL